MNTDIAEYCSQRGHALAASLAAGVLVQGRYRITRLLGQGAIDAVYQARTSDWEVIW